MDTEYKDPVDDKRAWRSWALYDWANSAFATTVMAGFFPLFFKAYWANQNNPSESTYILGLSNSIGSIVVAILAPFLGAIADRAGAKKKFLALFAFLGIVMTGGLWMVQQGQWLVAVLVYALAAIGFSSSNLFYDSLLPVIARKEKVDYVSALGFAWGYIGGGLLFLINVIMYLQPELFGIPDEATAIRISFVTVAIWWAVFSIPVFLFVKEPTKADSVGALEAISSGWKQLVKTIRDISHLKVVGMFLLAYWFYIDGVDTIVRMAVSYGTDLGFDSSALIIALLLVQFVAFPAALLYYRFSKIVGVKPAIMYAIGGYALITFLAYFMNATWHFYTLAVMIAIFQGGIQALSRSLYTRIIPTERSAEFFGFYNMFGKFAAVIGPFLMGYVTLMYDNPRLGILSVLVLFILGAVFLARVDVARGEHLAREYLAR
ncbi:MAG: MFS transporter [Anaerolineales bacterium]|nr:MFS transporter [Anaerolineales bacterium]